MSVNLNKIAQISINARDLPRAVAFYRDVLGMSHLFDAGPSMSFFDCGGVRLMLTLPERPEQDHPGSILYFKVNNIQQVHAELVAKAVKFESAPHLVAPMATHDLWMAFLRDSEGNLLALMAEISTR
jgi:predicted enzyme related to lactoylglutathione lyase